MKNFNTPSTERVLKLNNERKVILKIEAFLKL